MKSLPHFLDNVLQLINCASSISCISIDLFFNENLVLRISGEVETDLGDGVCTILVIKQSWNCLDRWKIWLYFWKMLQIFLSCCKKNQISYHHRTLWTPFVLNFLVVLDKIETSSYFDIGHQIIHMIVRCLISFSSPEFSKPICRRWWNHTVTDWMIYWR